MKRPSIRTGLKTLVVLAGCLAAGLAATHATPPSLQPLLTGKWPPPLGGNSQGVTVVGNYAYMADGPPGLQVIDVSDPAHCVRVGDYDTGGIAYGVAVGADRIYVADGQAGLLVLPTLTNVQFTVRVDATPGVPFTLEAATSLTATIHWSPIYSTNVSAMPIDYVDFDVKFSEKPHKFYRVPQP